MLSLIVKLIEGIILEFNAPCTEINISLLLANGQKDLLGYVLLYDDMTIIFCLFTFTIFHAVTTSIVLQF